MTRNEVITSTEFLKLFNLPNHAQLVLIDSWIGSTNPFTGWDVVSGDLGASTFDNGIANGDIIIGCIINNPDSGIPEGIIQKIYFLTPS